MKVLLINPWEPDIFPNPSIGYLQSVIKHWKVEVKALDLNWALNEPDDYDIVGVTFHSFSVKYARLIRQKFHHGKLICGGHHSSALPDQMLSIGYDHVVIGEGENAIISILEGNNEKKIYANDWEHKYFYGINEIPLPDYSGLLFNNVMGIPIISSRGCPFACSFCASSDFWAEKYRMRSAQNVLSEVELRKSQGYNSFMFEDDNFTLNKRRVVEICEGIRNIGGLSWQCASRAETLNDNELCWNLQSAGCHTVWLGIESLSQESLDRCNKKTTVEKMLTGIRVARSQGLETMSQFIIGLPGDTINNINETVNQIKQGLPGRRGTNILWVLPKTEIHDKALSHGFNDETFLTSGAPFYTYEQDMNTLNYWSYLINTA